jgi:hypothetical protein
MYSEAPVDDHGPLPKESSMRCADRLSLLVVLIAPLAGAACEGDYDSQPGAPTALLKFCNNRLGADNRPTEIVLEIGNPAVRVSARSGTCAPAKGACLAIQTGNAVPVTLREDGRQLISQLLEVQTGDEWILVAYPDAPILDGGELVQEVPCSSFVWADLQ